jgi:hypothetical protein
VSEREVACDDSAHLLRPSTFNTNFVPSQVIPQYCDCTAYDVFRIGTVGRFQPNVTRSMAILETAKQTNPEVGNPAADCEAQPCCQLRRAPQTCPSALQLVLESRSCHEFWILASASVLSGWQHVSARCLSERASILAICVQASCHVLHRTP